MNPDQAFITKSAEETRQLGYRIARDLTKKGSDGGNNSSHIFCLYGDLGSGKTTFSQGFAAGLGLTSRLPSPTFIIVRRYQIPHSEKLLNHIDLYRLHGPDQMAELGLTEMFADKKAYILIEWAERAEGILPVPRTDIHFTSLENGTHRLRITERNV